MQGKELSEHVPSEETYIGIDVCKSHLDVHIHPCDETWRVSNDRCGIAAFLRRLAALPVAVRLVVVEATGKWHRAVHRRLHEAGYDVAVVNPYRSRKLADAMGHLAKTDAIDARTLALFGQALRPRITPPPPKTVAALRELVAARRATVAEASALGNRLMTAEHGLPVILGTGILGQWGGLGPGAGFAKCNHGKRNKQQDAEEYGVGIYGSGHFIYISNIACACTVGGKYSPLCRIECCQKTCFLEARGFDCGIEIPGTG